MENYVKVDILFDDRADTVMSIVSSTHTNQTGILDTVVNHQVSKWRKVLDKELKQVIGYTAEEIPEKSDQMQNMITDAWLYMYPTAHIALTNTGGIRQSIPKGNITIETILGVLPFQNNILELELNGKEVIDCLHRSIVMGGMTTIGGYQLSDGRFLHHDSTYRVLVNDYIYSVSYMNYKKYDTEPYDTSISYHQPLIEWIKSMNTSTDKPLNIYLDKTPRKVWTKKSKK
jgi:2',3'-cyclic-nucleotide 2'-phosphodiesterase (5'-nucleotidase family)